MNEIIRPSWCYDYVAEILYTSYNEKGCVEGYSSFCYGKMNEPRIDTYKEVEHENNICHCYYTPFKGAIRFFINDGDLWGEIRAHLIVLNKVKPVGNCVACKEPINRRIAVAVCPEPNVFYHPECYKK